MNEFLFHRLYESEMQQSGPPSTLATTPDQQASNDPTHMALTFPPRTPKPEHPPSPAGQQGVVSPGGAPTQGGQNETLTFDKFEEKRKQRQNSKTKSMKTLFSKGGKTPNRGMTSNLFVLIGQVKHLGLAFLDVTYDLISKYLPYHAETRVSPQIPLFCIAKQGKCGF